MTPLWLIYALGGGWGHLTRAVALARAATPRCRVRILSNSPYIDSVRGAGLDIVALPSALTVDAAREQVPRHIRESGANCLIVDTFPRGLGGELVEPLQSFPGTKVLVARDLNPHYADAVGLEAFIRSSYHLVLNPGELGTGHRTAPWLLRSRDELLPSERARAMLGLKGDQPCIAVCASGNRDEIPWYGAVVSHLLALDSRIAVRAIAPVCPPTCPPDCWLSYWPAIDLYNAAAVVVGGAGYHTVYECLACGVPLIARPWPRKYDRQLLRAQRAAEHGSVTIVEEPEEAAIAALRQIHSPRECCAAFENGVHEAVALISQTVP